MLGFMGINLMFDENAIDPVPTVVNNINDISVGSCLLEQLTITHDIASTSTARSDYTTWAIQTIMNAISLDASSPSLAAGNVDFLGQTITKILVKRRDANDVSNTWTIVGQIDIEGDASKLHFDYHDVTNKANVDYKYALVPVFSQLQPNNVSIEVEGTPIESDTVTSEFDGVFICDTESFYRLYAGVSYGDVTVNQLTGVHQTLGREYPIIVANSMTNYKTGSLSAKVMTDDALNGGDLDRGDMVELSNEIAAFLTDKAPKIIKDWNGNVWLVVFTDTPSISYDSSWGMGIPTINANWTEVGDANDSNDLASAGISGYGGVS